MANITQINVNGTTYDLKDNISGYTTAYDGTTTSDTKYGALFLETLASGVDTVKVGLDVDLLWTNPSPTSDFASQTLPLDLANYNLFILISKTYKTNANNEGNVTSMFIKGIQSFAISGSGQNISSGTYLIEIRRGATFNDAGVVFGNAMQPTTTNNNAFMIPYQIYGIRGKVNDLTGD